MHARTRLSAVMLLSCASLLCTSHAAFAQREEPKPPGSDSDNEAPPPPPRMQRERSTEPAVVTTDPVTGADTTRPLKKFYPLDWVNGIGVYARYLFVTPAMLHPYLTHATGLNSFAVGLQYIRRFTHFDVVTSLDFSWLVLKDGNYLAASNVSTADLDTHYVQFDKLSFLSVDVSIIGHYAFNDWLELRGGAGLGLGAVLGSVWSTNDSNQVCTKQNGGNIHECYPISPTLGPIMLGQPNTNAQLAKTQNSADTDTAQTPHRNKATIPPAMAVLNIMAALNFRVMKQLSTQVELGFRDAMFVGAALQYHF